MKGPGPPLLSPVNEPCLFGLPLPSAAEWWQSIWWVLIVFTVLIGLALSGSFVSYQAVLTNGHPWLPRHYCPGCPLCGMTRSFCAMSSGEWRQAWQWNRGGPALYICFWSWMVAAFAYSACRLNRRVLLPPASLWRCCQESLRALRQIRIVRKDGVLTVRLEMPARFYFRRRTADQLR